MQTLRVDERVQCMTVFTKGKICFDAIKWVRKKSCAPTAVYLHVNIIYFFLQNTASITTPEPEVQIVKELSRDHKGIHLPPMKKLVETAEKEMKKEGEQPTTETAATAAGKGRRQQRIRNRGPYRNSEVRLPAGLVNHG
jgi:hypothetical protein